MGYLKAKMIKGKKYYYAVESKRINGKPRTVNQVYLGTLEQLVRTKKMAQGPQRAKQVAVFEFGLVATCVRLAEKLGVVDIIDEVVPKRKQGFSVGQYLLIAAISRVVGPVSKRGCWEWYKQTCLPRLWGERVHKEDLASQRFWDHMDKVPVAAIPEMENKLSERLLQLYDLDLRCLIYDTTNYYTYVDTFNRRNHIAQRGKNKQKRGDLRQVNLALAVTRDFHIPLFHKLYEGNWPDSRSFTSIVDELVRRYETLAQYCQDITLIYDKGNVSEANQANVDQSSYHFIGALKLNALPRLAALETTSARFQPMDDERLDGVKAYRTEEVIFGKPRTVVVLFSARFFEKQRRTLLEQTRKCAKRLAELRMQLRRWIDTRAAGQSLRGRPPTQKSVQKKLEAILRRQYMKEFFALKVREEMGLVDLQFSFVPEKFREIEKTRLGKTILFTDQHTWPTEEIILGYRGQYQIEKAFKVTKRGHFIGWRPTFHWTDQKLHIHAFYCLLSLLFVSLAQRQVWKAGIEISITALEHHLKNIKEVLIVQMPASGRARKARCSRVLTTMSQRQRAIYEALELDPLAPEME